MLNEPAVGNTFFGRGDVLETLEKRVSALKGGYRQNVALTGQMLSGKSSILHQFLYSLKDASIIPIYLEVVEESFISFADRFIATMLYNYLRSASYQTEKDLERLIKAAEKCLPRTVGAIKKLREMFSKRNHTEAYKKLFGLTSLLKEETQKSCVVILDEFHNLEYLKIKKPYLHFGKIIMIQKDTMYIVSSSQKSTIKKILSEKLSLLFGNFEIIEIAGFDTHTARAFVKEKLAGLTVPEEFVDYLIDFTDSNPFYLDVLSKKLAEIAGSQKEISAGKEILIEAFTALIYNSSGTINQYFTNSVIKLLEKSLREAHLELLIALACGCNKLGDISNWFDRKNAGIFVEKLGRLIDLDLVYKNGIFYEIQDKVFEFWLRTVYHKKKTALVEDVTNRTGDFRKEIARDMDEFMREQRKGASERIGELFSLFKGETVEVERKKRRLPRFIRIEVNKFEYHDDLVSYPQSDKYWIAEICHKKIDETAISDFLERYHGERQRVAKKICIALDGIETNALLLAKEKNIWVWNLSDLNNILKFYKKHNLLCR